MPKKVATPSKETKGGLKEIIMGVGAALAFIAALFSNYQKVISFIFPPDDVKVGWLTVRDPATLKKCVLVNDSNVFKLSSGREVQLASNACLMELRTLLSEVGSIDHIQEQKISASYFLLVENQGGQIDQLLLNPAATSSGDQDMIFREIDRGASIAICMGYDGNAGNPSKMNSVVEINVKRNASSWLDIKVPKRTQGTPIGVSKCGPIVWNYPE